MLDPRPTPTLVVMCSGRIKLFPSGQAHPDWREDIFYMLGGWCAVMVLYAMYYRKQLTVLACSKRKWGKILAVLPRERILCHFPLCTPRFTPKCCTFQFTLSLAILGPLCLSRWFTRYFRIWASEVSFSPPSIILLLLIVQAYPSPTLVVHLWVGGIKLLFIHIGEKLVGCVNNHHALVCVYIPHRHHPPTAIAIALAPVNSDLDFSAHIPRVSVSHVKYFQALWRVIGGALWFIFILRFAWRYPSYFEWCCIRASMCWYLVYIPRENN